MSKDFLEEMYYLMSHYDHSDNGILMLETLSNLDGLGRVFDQCKSSQGKVLMSLTFSQALLQIMSACTVCDDRVHCFFDKCLRIFYRSDMGADNGFTVAIVCDLIQALMRSKGRVRLEICID